jgi:hypothetical protein
MGMTPKSLVRGLGIWIQTSSRYNVVIAHRLYPLPLTLSKAQQQVFP